MHNMHSYGAFYRFPVAWTDSSADDWQSTCSGLQSTALWSCTSAWSTITATANLQSNPRRTLLKMAACRRNFVLLSLLTTLTTCNVMGLNQEDFIMRKHTSGSSQSSRKLGLIKACNKSKDPHSPQSMHNSTRWMGYPANQVGERQGLKFPLKTRLDSQYLTHHCKQLLCKPESFCLFL